MHALQCCFVTHFSFIRKTALGHILILIIFYLIVQPSMCTCITYIYILAIYEKVEGVVGST